MSLTFTILQLATPNIDAYAKFAIASVNRYAEKYGYGHAVQRGSLIHDMHINWTKIAMLKEALDKGLSDYLVVLDADIILTSNAHPLKSLVDLGSKNKHILMPGDTPLFGGKRPNAGLIIVKNSPEGREIVDYWLYAAMNEGRHLADTHPRNQLVYWNFVMPRYKEFQTLIPRWMAPKYYPIYDYIPKKRPFLWHVSQTNGQTREHYMTRLYTAQAGEMDRLSAISRSLFRGKEGTLRLSEVVTNKA